jgi:hypothetical protein
MVGTRELHLRELVNGGFAKPWKLLERDEHLSLSKK